jgi:Xaa-Pro dipeptidase
MTGAPKIVPVAVDHTSAALRASRPPSISAAERMSRIERAQELMRSHGLSALLVEPGATMVYLTGINTYRSERPTCAVITVDGEVGIITPYFEEASIREALQVPAEVRTWHEHQDALQVIAGWIQDLKFAPCVVGLENTTRYFITEGLAAHLPSATFKDAAAVVSGCRSRKSAAEIALMQYAADLTIAAYAQTIPQIANGMRPSDITAIMRRAHADLGGVPVFDSALIGEATAYPHGSAKPQVVREGELILMDCGCSVDGYNSDISRTFVVGSPTARQRKIWNHVKAGQRLAFEKAQIGVAAGEVDSAPRSYYESLGYGPDYKLPGLPHRTGHGIGLDIHEAVYLVKNETSALAPGMCFSNEPGIYIPGEFGVRIEDCFHMTEEGPKWFSIPSASIEQPV